MKREDETVLWERPVGVTVVTLPKRLPLGSVVHFQRKEHNVNSPALIELDGWKIYILLKKKKSTCDCFRVSNPGGYQT